MFFYSYAICCVSIFLRPTYINSTTFRRFSGNDYLDEMTDTLLYVVVVGIVVIVLVSFSVFVIGKRNTDLLDKEVNFHCTHLCCTST